MGAVAAALGVAPAAAVVDAAAVAVFAGAGSPTVGVGAAPLAEVGETVGSAVMVTDSAKTSGHTAEALLVLVPPATDDCSVTFVTPSIRANRCIV